MAGDAFALEIRRGTAPLVVSLPHTGTEIPGDLVGRYVSRERALDDTDWHIHRLYDFVVDSDATVIRTPVSRSAIDVNRDPSGASLYPGQATTGLCPATTFDGRPLYLEGMAPDAAATKRRREIYYDPYHAALADEIERLRSTHPSIVVYDCHSIRSEVPRLFAGTLPNFNIGTYAGASCDPRLTERIERRCDASGFSRVTDGRFKGGYITRRYGAPQRGVHAVQMETAIRTYMDEVAPDTVPPAFDPRRAAAARAVLADIIAICLDYVSEGT